jgi:hypothetical protein
MAGILQSRGEKAIGKTHDTRADAIVGLAWVKRAISAET